jgi:hypothetical protein
LGWLRSRWTVVALVPAFFLAGFGIVSALADGSDDPGPAGGSGGSPADGGGGSGGGGGGGAPPAPPPGVVGVDYGRWEGVFELASPGVLRGGGFASVTGELSYLGGVDCPVGLVRARTWLYDDRGRVDGETLWLSTDSTGEGAEVTGREPLPFDARAQASQDASSAVVRFGVVQCL